MELPLFHRSKCKIVLHTMSDLFSTLELCFLDLTSIATLLLDNKTINVYTIQTEIRIGNNYFVSTLFGDHIIIWIFAMPLYRC